MRYSGLRPLDPRFAIHLKKAKSMKRTALAAALILATLALAACGTSTTDRALSGGGIGAGVGAVGGALLGSPVEGALIGGAVGAGAGALTTSEQVDLGRPLWR